MLHIERLLQFAFLLLVSTSGLLLAFSQQDSRLAMVAIFSATMGLIFCDTLKWIRLKSWVANILSVVVLVFAMRTFFDGDTGGQLVAVANLLVYLQLVLLFQEKSPRIYWQISVLSLLQVVVATIFNLQFEGGLFFIFYMLLAGTALTLLTIYHQSWNAKKASQTAKRRLNAYQKNLGTLGVEQKPLALFDHAVRDQRIVRKMLRHLVMWVAVSLVFASILFYKIPRTDSAWFGPRYHQSTATGANKELELDERNRINLGSEIVMRCKFIDPETEETIQLTQPPYFRGMALSSVVIEDEKTNFRAPYDRVYGFVYEELPFQFRGVPHIRMDVTLEATTDPLIYACMPSNRNRNTPKGIEFCHELSSITRKRQGERIEMSPLKYSFAIHNKLPRTLPQYWPYVPETKDISGQSMVGNPGQWNWLTHLDRERYPELVRLADRVAARAPRPDDTLSVARELTQQFLLSEEFTYTLDFRQVPRDDSLDPIEDFVRNHKTGHCSLYAASLCMMLRSQGIPARVVVGYLGGSYNELGGFYLVTGQHAHSWVEAYIPPSDCSEDMKEDSRIARGGAWVRLDGTPETAVDFSTGEDALDLARTLWQDYVLGLDDRQQGDGWFSGNSALLGLLDINRWGDQFQNSFSTIKSSPLLSTLLLVSVIAIAIAFTLINIRRSKRKTKQKNRQAAGRFRRLLGKAVSLISPNLGTWILQGTEGPRVVAFYEKLIGILKRHGHVREPNQTHLEFAESVSAQYKDHSGGELIDQNLRTMTELFNQIRFGAGELGDDTASRIDGDLALLESSLSQTKK